MSKTLGLLKTKKSNELGRPNLSNDKLGQPNSLEDFRQREETIVTEQRFDTCQTNVIEDSSSSESTAITNLHTAIAIIMYTLLLFIAWLSSLLLGYGFYT